MNHHTGSVRLTSRLRIALLGCGLFIAGGWPGQSLAVDPTPSVGGGSMLPSASAWTDRTVAVGKEFAIRLPANPSTGYGWAIDAAASEGLAKLTPAGEVFEMPDQTPTRVGAPGEQVFHFVATQPGVVRVVFLYRRPWESAGASDTARMRITIE